MAQHHNPKIVTNGLIYHLDPTNGGKGGSKIITKPTVIDNCILWLDADDKESIVESSNLVSNWLDKSGEGNHAAQGTSTNQPTYTAGAVNGRATISFDGTDNHMDVAGLSGTTFGSNGGVTFFMVVRQVAFDNNGAGFYFGGQSGDPTTQNYMGCGTSGGDSMDFRMYGPDGTGGEMQTYYQDTGGYNIHAGLWDKTNVSIYFNGYLGGTTTSNVTSSNWTTDEPAKIAESWSATTYTKMNISEIILFNRNLSDTERQQVERYLSLKWAIPLRATVTTNLADGVNTTISDSGPAETAHSNTLYFPNPDDDNCDLRLEANEIAIADNLPWTIEFWIKRHARGGMGGGVRYDGVWGNSYASSNYERMQFGVGDEDKLEFVDAASSGAEITNVADLDCLHKWRHVVFAFDGTTDATTAGSLRQYVDGSDKGPAIAIPSSADSGITIRRIGSRGHATDNGRIEGELGNFRVYNKQLSHAEVLQNYNAQRAKYENKKMSFAAPDNLKLYLDADSGTSANDFTDSTWYDLSGGTAYNATRANATMTTTSPSSLKGNYYDFDGGDDRFSIGSSGMNVSTTAITISTWVRFDGIGDSWIIANLAVADYTKGYLLRIDHPSNTIGFYIGYGAGSHAVWSTNTISTGVWYNIVCTYKSGEQYLYVNGDVWAQSLSATGSIDYTGLTTGYIGTASDLSRDFNGQMANLMIYDTVLSPDQIMQNYNYFKHRFGK